MIKARIPVGDTSIEIEAVTKLELEDALEAALNVVMRMNVMPQKAYREPETPLATGPVREFPPVQAGGDNSPQEPQAFHEPKETQEEPQKTYEQEPQREELQKELSSMGQPDAKQKVSYKKAKRLADYARIALDDLGKKHGTGRGFTSIAIREHLEATGGDIRIKDNVQPTAAISQAIKNSKVFVRHNGVNWLKEWIAEDTKESQESQSSEFIEGSYASSSDF